MAISKLEGTALLTEHEFFRRLLAAGLETALALGDRGSFAPIDAQFERTPDEHEFYILTAAHALTELMDTFSQLEHAVLYMTEFTYSSTLRTRGVTRADYLHYTIENFIIRTQIVLERSVHLVSSVFHILTDPRDCTYRSVVRHIAVVRTNVPAALRKVSRITEAYRDERNSVVHRESYKDEFMRRVKLFHLPSSSESKIAGLPHMRDQLTRRFVAERKTHFGNFNATPSNVLAELLTALSPVYDDQRARLAKLEGS